MQGCTLFVCDFVCLCTLFAPRHKPPLKLAPRRQMPGSRHQLQVLTWQGSLTVLANLHAVSLGALPTGAEATAQKQTAARKQKQTAARRLWHRRRCARTHHGHHPSQHGHANKHGHASKIDGHQDGHRILGHKGRVRAHETTSLFIFARALDDGAQEYQTTFRRCDGTATTPQ